MMYPRRKMRIVRTVFAALLMCALIVGKILVIEDIYTMRQQADEWSPGKYAASIIHNAINAAVFPWSAPLTENTINRYLDKKSLQNLTTPVPILPAPFDKFTHFIYCYRYHGTTKFITRDTTQTGYVIEMLDHFEKKTKWNYPTNRRWSQNLNHITSGDTIYYRGVFVDLDARRPYNVALVDTVLETIPLRWMVAVHGKPMTVLDWAGDGKFRIMITDSAKRVIYQRGDTVRCQLAYHELWLGEDTQTHVSIYSSGVPYLVDNRISKKLKRLQWTLAFDFTLLLLLLAEGFYFRGYPISKKRRELEMEWERERSQKP